MTTPRHQYIQVFVVIRIGLNLIPISGVAESLRAVEVLPTFAEAQAECARLNAGTDPSKKLYVVSASHWYPDGRQVEGADSPSELPGD